ncbi:MAG: ATP-dependent helicase [Paludibacter sp.]|nr:ATP-dependent helicase [Paludibacter sp.]
MELTQEQVAIIQSSGNIKINAVAGSGKTTTIIEYARSRPTNCKILYLAFNKLVKIDAQKKFTAKGIRNVTIETAHSLAHRYIVRNSAYTIRTQDYRTYELIELLQIHISGDKLLGHIIANHIIKFTAYFCNSNANRMQELNYLDVITDGKAYEFVKTNYSYIESKTRQLLSKMDKAEIEITHDFYLKKFQLSKPQLAYDYILFDEGQDASPAMLEVFLGQSATKVIVGDTHQQIYGWRYAVNSLEKADYTNFYLRKSFRFSQSIANLGIEILKWKKKIEANGDVEPVNITGAGTSTETQIKAVLARTNLGLLVKAIEYITEKKSIERIYFEGKIQSYTYADNGTSLYDVLNLYKGNRRRIKDKLIRSMHDFAELEEYIDKTEDRQLGMLVEIVKEYGEEIPAIIENLKTKHVENKDEAQIIFSTIHRCKGMEYDTVQLVNDFITEEDINKQKPEALNQQVAKINEEINLLYVAVTRTRNSLYIPENLLPLDFVCNHQIHKMRVDEVKKDVGKDLVEGIIQKMIPRKNSSGYDSDKSYLLEEIRLKHTEAYMPWTIAQDDELSTMYCEGVNVKDMAKHFGRSRGAINSRIKKLELKEKYQI